MGGMSPTTVLLARRIEPLCGEIAARERVLSNSEIAQHHKNKTSHQYATTPSKGGLD